MKKFITIFFLFSILSAIGQGGMMLKKKDSAGGGPTCPDPTAGLGTVYETQTWGGSSLNHSFGTGTPTIGDGIVMGEQDVVIEINITFDSLTSGVIMYSNVGGGCGGFAIGLGEIQGYPSDSVSLYVNAGINSGTDPDNSARQNDWSRCWVKASDVLTPGVSHQIVVEISPPTSFGQGSTSIWVDNELVASQGVPNMTPICSFEWADAPVFFGVLPGGTNYGIGNQQVNDIADVSGTPTANFWENTLSNTSCR